LDAQQQYKATPEEEIASNDSRFDVVQGVQSCPDPQISVSCLSFKNRNGAPKPSFICATRHLKLGGLPVRNLETLLYPCWFPSHVHPKDGKITPAVAPAATLSRSLDSLLRFDMKHLVFPQIIYAMARAVPTRLTSRRLPLVEALILNLQVSKTRVQSCRFQHPLPTSHSSSHTNSELQESQDKFHGRRSRLPPFSHTASPLISEKNVLCSSVHPISGPHRISFKNR